MPHSPSLTSWTLTGGCQVVLLDFFWLASVLSVSKVHISLSKVVPAHESLLAGDDDDHLYFAKRTGTLSLWMPRPFSNRPNLRRFYATPEMRVVKHGCDPAIDSILEKIVKGTSNMRLNSKLLTVPSTESNNREGEESIMPPPVFSCKVHKAAAGLQRKRRSWWRVCSSIRTRMEKLSGRNTIMN